MLSLSASFSKDLCVKKIGSTQKSAPSSALPPAFLISIESVGGSALIGEIAREKGLIAVMISHGSHALQDNCVAAEEWRRHAQCLLTTPYPYTAIQSTLAERYFMELNGSSRAIKTGPLVWGKRIPGRKERPTFIKSPEHVSIVMHAGTPKTRPGRFYIYETADEYIASLNHLISTIEKLPGVLLIIRFRACPGLDLKVLKRLLRPSQCYRIVSEGLFVDLLQETDLLVSSASTSMEEAIEHNVPVLQYAHHGRYNFLPGVNVDNLRMGDRLVRSPSYFVTQGKSLLNAIPAILALYDQRPLVEEEKKDFCIPLSQRQSLGDLVNEFQNQTRK